MSDNKDLSGFLGPDDLQEVETNHFMNPKAATAYALMVQAAKDAGVSWGVTDSYRDYGQQVDVYNRKGDYSQGGWAAKPGTSQHGWGNALDLNNQKGSGLGYNSAQFKWLNDNASKYGFSNIPREPWHWQFDNKTWGKYNQGAPWLGVTSTQASAAQKAANIEGLGKQNITVKSDNPTTYRMGEYKGPNKYTSDNTLLPDKGSLGPLGGSSTTPAESSDFSGVGKLTTRIA